MKALLFETFGGIDKMAFKNINKPEPLPDEVQIQIEYAAVNPVDWKLSEGVLKTVLTHQFPITVGWDASGIVSKVGRDVKNYRIGDPVYAYCRKEVVHDGTYAEFVTFRANDIALKPKTLTFEQAAAVPLCALTAWQAFFDIAHLKKGESVLIHAGAGGVGSFAIQIAKWAGAKVYTTASAHNHPYVKMLGADVAIDYTQENFVDAVKALEPEGVDLVFDCAGGKAQDESFKAVKKGGRIVSIVGRPSVALAEEYGVESLIAFVRPSGEELREIGKLIDADVIEPPEITILPFEKAKEALVMSKKGHTRGKIVLRI